MLDVMQWLFVKSWLVCAVDHLGGPSFGGEPVLLVENDQQRAVPQRVSRLAILVGRPRMDLSDRQQRTRRRWDDGAARRRMRLGAHAPLELAGAGVVQRRPASVALRPAAVADL